MKAEEELELLRSQLREKEEQVHQAARAGLDLLNQQMELDKQRVEMTNALEVLEQDNYSLQKEMDLKTHMLESLQSDYECMKQQKQQLQEQHRLLERSHSLALTELHNKILMMKLALEESQMNAKQLKHKLEVQAQTRGASTNWKRNWKRHAALHTQKSVTSEVTELQVKIVNLEAYKVESEQALQECKYKEQQMVLEKSSLQRQLQHITEEKEEREKEAVSWFNALEKSRKAIRNLRIQLDQVHQEAQDPNSKGNSLFAEQLDDKRAAIERQLISMKVQYQSLQKLHAFSKQQMQRMKMKAEEELELLRSQLREKEEQVHQAARAGLDLLNQQMELQNRLDEQRVEMTNALEVLEQDNYSLQKEVKLKSRMLESLQSDYECMKQQQEQQLQQQHDNLERSHSLALTELHNKMLMVQLALEESQLSATQLKHKLEVQTVTLNNKLEELRALNEDTQSSMTSEVIELQMKIVDLEAYKVESEQALQECKYKEQQMVLEKSSLQRQLQHITEEKEEREKEAVSWFNALEKSREAIRDLQIQLDQVHQEAQDPNSKGNSLFAELDDKRAAMERQLISMKVQYQSLQKLHAFSKQQMQRMKVQIATLMLLQGSRADPAQLERLQAMLSEKNGEIQGLMTKLQKLEKVEMLSKTQPANQASAEDDEGRDTTYYTDLLKMKLNNSVKDAERLGDELSLQRMKSLSESQRALELERKLFTSERLLKQAQSDKIKLQLQVEELQHKYEPKEARKISVQKRKKEKLPVDVAPTSDKTLLVKAEHAVATVTNVTDGSTADPAADPQSVEEPASSAQEPEPRPAKCVKISPEEPVVIPNQSSPPTECKRPGIEINQQQNREEERRKRQKPVEIIHVGSQSTMADQCAQQ